MLRCSVSGDPLSIPGQGEVFGGGASERQTLLLNYLVWLFGEKSAQPKRNQSLVAGARERNIHISIVGFEHRKSYEGTGQDSLGLFHVSETIIVPCRKKCVLHNQH